MNVSFIPPSHSCRLCDIYAGCLAWYNVVLTPRIHSTVKYSRLTGAEWRHRWRQQPTNTHMIHVEKNHSDNKQRIHWDFNIYGTFTLEWYVELIVRRTTPDIRCRHRRYDGGISPARWLEAETADISEIYCVEPLRPSSDISDNTYQISKQAHITLFTMITKASFCQLPISCCHWQPCTCNRLGLRLHSSLKLRQTNTTGDPRDGAISVLNHCLEWYKWVLWYVNACVNVFQRLSTTDVWRGITYC